jgi:archaemetzincin
VKPIHLMTVVGNGARTEPGLATLEHLAVGLARVFRTPCRVRPESLDATFALEPARSQYYSTAILQRMERVADPDARVLAITNYDLYVPVLTFVFGEAQLEGFCAVVSTARLKEEFYGMPGRPELMRERLLKEAVHELGHTFGLRHCPDWRCAMSSSYGIELLDVKTEDFCPACRKEVFRLYR